MSAPGFLDVALRSRLNRLQEQLGRLSVAALYHLGNHSLYKALLFLGAGSVDAAGGGRDMDRLGGLIRTMPWTALFFLAGALSIAANAADERLRERVADAPDAVAQRRTFLHRAQSALRAEDPLRIEKHAGTLRYLWPYFGTAVWFVEIHDEAIAEGVGQVAAVRRGRR
ncbi:MAG: proton-conducting transporter transmembrane domain-containing protein [bacterium]